MVRTLIWLQAIVFAIVTVLAGADQGYAPAVRSVIDHCPGFMKLIEIPLTLCFFATPAIVLTVIVVTLNRRPGRARAFAAITASVLLALATIRSFLPMVQ